MFTYRTVALALLTDAYDEKSRDAVPQETWDSLYAEGLVENFSDQTGEATIGMTNAGRELLMAALRGDNRA